MADSDKITVEVDKSDLKHQLAKVLVSTAAGFIASKLAENAYERLTTKKTSNAAADD